MSEPSRQVAVARRVPGRARLAVWIVLAAASLYVAATFAVPLAAERWPAAAGLALLWAPACHQMSERCLTIAGATQTVCARCSGLYLGGIAGMLAGALWMLGRRAPSPWWLAALAAPSVIDFGLGLVSLPQLDNVPRLLLALAPGALLGLYFSMGIAEAFGAGPARGAARPARPVSLAETGV